MQDGVRRTSHRDVKAHGVVERRLGGDGAWEDGGVVLVVPALGQGDDGASGCLEEFATIRVGGQQGTVAGQGEAEGLRQAVHRVGGEHARTRPAGRAGIGLHDLDVGVGRGLVTGGDHGVDEVELVLPVGQSRLPSLHRATGDEDGRDVEAHGGHQHAGGDLVAVGDAHEGVGTVSVDHVLHGVGDELTAGQGVEHAVVAHGDAVVDGNGVELLGDATGGADLLGDDHADVTQSDVSGDELGEGVRDRHDGMSEFIVLGTGGTPESAGSGHGASGGAGGGSQRGHRVPPRQLRTHDDALHPEEEGGRAVGFRCVVRPRAG